MTNYLSISEILVPKNSEPMARKLIDKILELCVRTDFLKPDVLRAGSYVENSLSDYRQKGVVIRETHPEIAMIVGDGHATAKDFADQAAFKERTPRFYLAATVLSGIYNIASEPREMHEQKIVEEITLTGGPIEGLLKEEVEEDVKEGFPLTLQYRVGEGDAELDLSDLSEEELTEAVNALLLSFWIRYEFAKLNPQSEMWTELHLTDDEFENYELGLRFPGGGMYSDDFMDEDEYNDHEAWSESLDTALPPEEPGEAEPIIIDDDTDAPLQEITDADAPDVTYDIDEREMTQ